METKKDFGVCERKRILFVIPYLADGGAERALSNIVMHFPEEWEIDILINSDKRIDYPYRGRLLTLKIDEKPRTASVFFQAKAFWKRLVTLRRLKKQNNYKACISFLDSANVANILSGKKYCKVIVSVRSSLVNQAVLPQYKYIVNPLVRLLYNKADKVVAVSKGSGIELEEVFHLHRQKIAVIGNGYDMADLYKGACQIIDDELEEKLAGKKVILSSGRIDRVKGQQHLLRAFARVARQESNVALLIVGDGEDKDALLQLVHNSEIADRVYFVGYQKNPYKFASRADLFVIPSLYEGFPNALAEAACLGTPCIATDFQTGAREILAPQMLKDKKEIKQMTLTEYGIITPLCSGKRYESINDPLEEAEEELAKAMLLLVQDEDKRKYYAEKSRQHGKEFDIISVVNRWINVINE